MFKFIQRVCLLLFPLTVLFSFSLPQAKAESSIPVIKSVNIKNVSETGFDVTLDVTADSGVNEIKLALWRSGNYAGLIYHVYEDQGNGSHTYHVNISDLGAGSDYVYIGVHVKDYAGNSTSDEGVDYPFKLDSISPEVILSQSSTAWSSEDTTITAKMSDNFNIIEEASISGPGLNQTVNEFSKPKILSLGPQDENRYILSYLQSKDYDVTVKQDVVDVNQLSGYDLILYDGSWGDVPSSIAPVLNQAYEQGYKILTVGNDTVKNNGIHPVTDTENRGNTEYGFNQYTNQGIVSDPKYTDYQKGKYDHLMSYYDGLKENDTSSAVVTAYPSDTRPIAMDTAGPSSPVILESINNNGGKWLHFQAYNPHGLMTNRAIDELMWGCSAKRQAYSSEFKVSKNGTYTITAKDFSGNTTTKTITVSNIDTTAPTLPITGNPTSLVHTNVTLTLNALDDQSGVKRIQTPDGKWVSGSKATYKVTTNGSYKFIAEDNVGNQAAQSITVTEIGEKLWVNKSPSGTLSTDPITLNGHNQLLKIQGTTIEIQDNRETGEGWHISVSASPFKDNKNHSLPAGSFQIKKPAITGTDNTPSSPVAVYQAIDLGSSVDIVKANTGQGEGAYSVNMDALDAMQATIPASTYAGNYRTNILWQLSSAP